MTNIKCPKYICIVARTCIAMLYLYCCSFYSKNILRRIMHNNSTQYTLPFFFIINTVPRCWSRAQMWFGFVVCVFETILFPCASHCLSRTQLILVLMVFFSSGSATFDGDNTAVWVGWENRRGRLDSRALGHTLLSIDICCDDLGGDFFSDYSYGRNLQKAREFYRMGWCKCGQLIRRWVTQIFAFILDLAKGFATICKWHSLL